MVLEATVLLLDNSEWMRNGDYSPSRFEAQIDAVNLIFSAKTQSNPENNVGLVTMSGKSADVLVTLTSNVGKILAAVHKINLNGSISLANGLMVSQLVLKHRQNKNQRQRIVAFVGSPIQEDDKALVKLGKKLKKNNVAVDIVNFGEESLNTAKLEAFIEAVNSQDNSHLVNIPPGPHILSDLILSSPIISGEDGVPAGLRVGGQGFEFGVDPELDPELALALRISMEEEKARQESLNASNTGESKQVPAYKEAPVADEDAMLAEAIAMSMGGSGTGTAGDKDVAMKDVNEEEELQKAIRMSMGGRDIDSVLGSLPGVDPNDPRIKNALKDTTDVDLQKAVRASMGGRDIDSVVGSSTGIDPNDPRFKNAFNDVTMNEADEDEELQRAIQMSMQGRDIDTVLGSTPKDASKDKKKDDKDRKDKK